jgi:DNA polymerase
LLLQNLYRLKSIGFDYIDPIVINHKDEQTLPAQLGPLHSMISQCHLCDLSKSRRQPMSGQGNPKADVMFVDAYVSMAEDESGEYFVGRSGTSLKKMIENVLEMSYEETYITHAVKCKPLGTKTPSTSEWNSCKSYLFKQIELVSPRIIVPLGPDAYQMLCNDESPFEQVRGQKIDFGASSIIPIFHPAYLLRNPSQRQTTFNDLQFIKSLL